MTPTAAEVQADAADLSSGGATGPLAAAADAPTPGRVWTHVAWGYELTTRMIAAYYRALVHQAVSDFEGRVHVEGGPDRFTVHVADFPPMAVTRRILQKLPAFDPEPDVDTEAKHLIHDLLIQQITGMLSGANLALSVGQAAPKRFFTPK